MPVYTNGTGSAVTVPGKTGNVTIENRQTIKTDFFIPDEYGLTLDNEEPRVEPQTMASGTYEIYNGDSEKIYIPKCRAFLASIICESGSAEIRESYKDAAIYVKCDTQNMFHASFRRPDVEALWVKGTGDDADGPAHITCLISRLS
jgi:hypothetical protein